MDSFKYFSDGEQKLNRLCPVLSSKVVKEKTYFICTANRGEPFQREEFLDEKIPLMLSGPRCKCIEYQLTEYSPNISSLKKKLYPFCDLSRNLKNLKDEFSLTKEKII